MINEANVNAYLDPIVICSIFTFGSYLLSNMFRRIMTKKTTPIPATIQPQPEAIEKPVDVTFPFEHEKKMSNRLRMNSGADDDNIPRTKVIVRVPATSANLGPGFDAIGMALDMWSEFTIERSDKFEVICEGEGSYDMPTDESNLVCFGLKTAFEKAGKPVPTLRYHLVNRIPYARGLGSSSAAIVGGLVAGLVLAGHQVPAWGSEELLNMAAEIEGHPDNVAPALYGGIQLGIHTGSRWMTERVSSSNKPDLTDLTNDFFGRLGELTSWIAVRLLYSRANRQDINC
jgi:homoserine kinase